MFPKNIKILVVNDMPGMRKMIKGQLVEMGYRFVTEAENGDAAHKLIIRQLEIGNPFDLILSDWNMPVLPGIELLKRVREDPRTASMPFILITAEQDFSQVKDAIKLKVSDYIVKPFTPATIKLKFDAVFKKHYPMGLEPSSDLPDIGKTEGGSGSGTGTGT